MKHPFLAPTLAAAACAAAHAQVTLTDYGAPDALSFEARGVSGDGSKLLGFLYLNNCWPTWSKRFETWMPAIWIWTGLIKPVNRLNRCMSVSLFFGTRHAKGTGLRHRRHRFQW